MSDCVIASGRPTTHGYVPKNHDLAHRVAWEEKRGPVPDGLYVLHTCDKRACVQNDESGVYLVRGVEHPRQGHLWLGTQQDNIDDMYAKGRARTGVSLGSKHYCAKLDEGKVREARRLHANGARGADLAREYGVTSTAMYNALHGFTWSHVK